LKPLVRGIQLSLQRGRISTLDPVHDLPVVGRHLRFVFLETPFSQKASASPDLCTAWRKVHGQNVWRLDRAVQTC
jgi:hypothetical protein